MNFKRETSMSVSDLHLSTVSENIKRLAISHENNEPTEKITDSPSIQAEVKVLLLCITEIFSMRLLVKYIILFSLTRTAFIFFPRNL